MWNTIILYTEVLHNVDTFIQFCVDKGLVKDTMLCPYCRENEWLEPYYNDKSHGIFGFFRCQKKCHGRRGPFKQSVATGTWFEHSRLVARKNLLFIYLFAVKADYESMERENRLTKFDTHLSSKTIADWTNFLREVCMVWLDEKFVQVGRIGGPGIVVEIDESKIGKRKYNRGRLVEGHWIFGMIERLGNGEKGKFRLAICPDNKRDQNTLLPIIQDHIEQGSIIHSDGWGAYVHLEDYGYEHYTVIHDRNFVDPVTGCHTQTIESNWRTLKREICRGGCSRNLDMHMCEYLFRHEMARRGKDIFEGFIEAIASVYMP